MTAEQTLQAIAACPCRNEGSPHTHHIHHINGPDLHEIVGASTPPPTILIGDGGGKGPQWASGIFRAENVVRLLASTFPWFVRIGGKLEPREVNGHPGAIFRDRDNKVFSTWTLDELDGWIQTIRTVINPDKLGHVGPVADLWAVVREANRARRPTD